MDILFSLLTFYFAFRLLIIVIPAIFGASQSEPSFPILLTGMTFFLGLTYAIRVVEMLVTDTNIV